MPGLPAWVNSVSELLTNVGTSDDRDSRRSSGLSTRTVEQTVSTTDAGTPGLGQVSVGTPRKRRDSRRSELPTNVETSDVHRQSVSQKHRCRDSRLRTGLPTVESSNIRQDFRRPQSPCRLSDWESELPAKVMTSDCREFWLTSGLPTPTVTEK